MKGELGFSGIVVSDWAGIDQISPDYPTAVRTGVNAGIDMVMVPTDYKRFISTLRDEVNAGRVPMARIDDAVTRILTQKFALGLFTKFTTDRALTAQVGSAAHRAVARQAVRESMVLLKNDGRAAAVPDRQLQDRGRRQPRRRPGPATGRLVHHWQGASGTTTSGTTFWQALQAAPSRRA